MTKGNTSQLAMSKFEVSVLGAMKASPDFLLSGNPSWSPEALILHSLSSSAWPLTETCNLMRCSIGLKSCGAFSGCDTVASCLLVARVSGGGASLGVMGLKVVVKASPKSRGLDQRFALPDVLRSHRMLDTARRRRCAASVGITPSISILDGIRFLVSGPATMTQRMVMSRLVPEASQLTSLEILSGVQSNSALALAHCGQGKTAAMTNPVNTSVLLMCMKHVTPRPLSNESSLDAVTKSSR